jgi:hypothetical protein
MLRIHDDMLHAITTMRPMLSAIERRDSDLARQLRRCASSVVLNIAEGSGSFGRVRTARYRTALGSGTSSSVSESTGPKARQMSAFIVNHLGSGCALARARMRRSY